MQGAQCFQLYIMIFFFMIFFLQNNSFTFHTFAVCMHVFESSRPSKLSLFRIPLPNKHIKRWLCAQKIAQAWIDKRHKSRGANHCANHGANHGGVQICFSARLFNTPTCSAVFRNAGEEPQLCCFTKALLDFTRGVQVKYSSIPRHQRETTCESAFWHSVVTRKSYRRQVKYGCTGRSLASSSEAMWEQEKKNKKNYI